MLAISLVEMPASQQQHAVMQATVLRHLMHVIPQQERHVITVNAIIRQYLQPMAPGRHGVHAVQPAMVFRPEHAQIPHRHVEELIASEKVPEAVMW
jgi:hypothetical protein